MPLKSKLSNLALFGGDIAFKNSLHVGRPNIGDRQRFEERVSDILDRKWLTNGGKYVQEFERQIEQLIGVKHCIAMCNATVALEIAVRALDLQGEVIIPSFTFIATAHALQWLGITPVFCDIDRQTYNIDPQRVEQLITPRTSAVMGVHVYGRACDCDALENVARSHNVKLLYDAAHAFGCSYQGRMIGNFGDLEVFSFHATKFLNSLEGGAVVTNSDELAKKVRMMRNFGFTYYDRVDDIGTNGKMNEVSAAMGLTNLEAIDEFISANCRNYQFYQAQLAGMQGIRLITFDYAEKYNYQYVVIEIDPQITGVKRDDLFSILHAENVLARRYFFPGCHQMEPYRSYFPHAGLLLPETEKLCQRVLCLPSGTAVEEGDIDLICQIIRTVLAHPQEVAAKLETTV